MHYGRGTNLLNNNNCNKNNNKNIVFYYYSSICIFSEKEEDLEFLEKQKVIQWIAYRVSTYIVYTIYALYFTRILLYKIFFK